MKVEDRIARAAAETERNQRVAEMTQLLETPLDPSLDYFDATASIEAIAEHIRGLHKLINFLSHTLVSQGQSLIRQQGHIAAQQGAIETLANIVGAEEADQGTGLVGFEKPKLELN